MYNEIEPFAAQWLRNLEAKRHIAPGRVETRSIAELQPNEIDSPQFHAFAGIGVWSHALRVAGYDDAWNVWTGSCPCQPFSQAGRRAAKSDARHLWPEWFRLIRERRPRLVLGEQVASPLGLGWLDSVQADLEGEGYAFGAVDLCAAGFSAPHIRQRLYFAAIRADGMALSTQVGRGWRSNEQEHLDDRAHGRWPEGKRFAESRSAGDATLGMADHWREGRRQVGAVGGGRGGGGGAQGVGQRSLHGGELGGRPLADAADLGRVGRQNGETGNGRDASRLQPQRLRDARGLGHSDIHGGWRLGGTRTGAQGGVGLWAVGDGTGASGSVGRLGDAGDAGPQGHGRLVNLDGAQGREASARHGPETGTSEWEWLYCRDGKWRPTQPGLQPLAHGATQRVGRLRAYGNAIEVRTATAFLQALKPQVEDFLRAP